MAAFQDSPFSLMIVEDDKGALDILARMIALRFPDLRIFTAHNGRVGLELFREHAPDLVLTDISMPEMDGIDMARQIRSIHADAGLIVLTAYRDQDLLKKFSEIGFCAYMMKPIDFKLLFETIEKCLGKDCNLNGG